MLITAIITNIIKTSAHRKLDAEDIDFDCEHTNDGSNLRSFISFINDVTTVCPHDE